MSMSTDNSLIYGSSLILLIFNILVIRETKKVGIVSLAVQLAYSSYFYYGLFFDLRGGLILGFLLCLLLFTCSHLIILVVYLCLGKSNK